MIKNIIIILLLGLTIAEVLTFRSWEINSCLNLSNIRFEPSSSGVWYTGLYDGCYVEANRDWYVLRTWEVVR